MKRGFTLIELLVTISIIAVLSAIGFATYQGIQSKARDGVRKNDLQKVATVLEIYFQKNNKYVEGSETCQQITDNFYFTIAPSSGKAPKDPSTGGLYCYMPINNGQAFRLFAKLENLSDADIITDCTSTNYNYSVVSQDLTIICPP